MDWVFGCVEVIHSWCDLGRLQPGSNLLISRRQVSAQDIVIQEEGFNVVYCVEAIEIVLVCRIFAIVEGRRGAYS
jgi:hypothetical protein